MKFQSAILAAALAVGMTAAAGSKAGTGATPSHGDDYVAYLFTYFTGNHGDQEAVRYAISEDGYNFKALNGNRPVISSEAISVTGGVRDPHILRGEDGNFYMVLTDMVSDRGWDSNRGLVMLKSKDLLHWDHSVVYFPERYADQRNLRRVWAPQTIYDPEAGKYMVYFSTQYVCAPDVICYAYANKDFTGFEGEPKILFMPKDGKSCIDADIVYKDGKFHMFYKTEGHGNGIKVATTDSLTSGKWDECDEYKQLTTDPVEGSGTFKLIGQDKYILMYDVYMNKRYEFTETTDLEHFTKASTPVTMDFHPRHGTVIPITANELARLREAYK